VRQVRHLQELADSKIIRLTWNCYKRKVQRQTVVWCSPTK